MSQTATNTKRALRFPGEEPIMVRYSPHHEFPLSTVTSVGLHALVLGLLIVGGIVIARLNWGGDKPPVAVDAVALEEQAGGGGGNPNGIGNGPGDGDLGQPDAPDAPLPDPSQSTVVEQRREQLKEARAETLQLPVFNDEEGRRLIEEGGAQVDKILRLKADVRKKLSGVLAGKGKGGPGRGGGEGTGDGGGRGGSTGPGTGNSESRAKRVLRWTLLFNTRDGRDYLNQLKAFGAILAVPDDKAPDGYLVIRDLNNPTPKAEDIAEIKRIFWIDDKPASVRSLAAALKLPTPAHFVVFFPVAFEEELLKMELAYRGRKESEITETRFEVRRGRGERAYDPHVLDQR
jgi:hypothetical protein